MDRAWRIAIAALPLVIVTGLLLLSRVRPGYLLNPRYLAGMILLQLLLVCLWSYDRWFFPLLMTAFLWAGTEVPLREIWTSGRWAVLAAGTVVGFVRWMKTGVQGYHSFHLVAFFCVASAMVSAMVSAIPWFSFLKALSLLLLFLYGATGARLILRNPDQFVRGLLLACEINVYVSALCYLILGIEFWGNQNSLGAVQGVVAAPVLLWGAIVAHERTLRVRYAIACLGALYLVYASVTRAAMLATCLAMLVFLVAVRQHGLIWRSLLILVCLAAVIGILFPSRLNEYKESLITGVIYKGHLEQGLLGSRLTPWQETWQVIRENPFFGSGFGTSVSGDKPFGEVGRFASSSVLREHGSSYLAIAEYVGLLGLLPFLLLIFLLIRGVVRVFLWLRRTGNPHHYAVPFMLVLIAGLVHAGFEDWMFAVGFYLTVFFWVSAFLLMDLAPRTATYHTMIFHGMRFRYAASPEVVRH